jgi:hypothetical protein
MVTAGSGEGMVNSDDIGIDIVAGNWYSLMAGWDCEAETGLAHSGETTWALGTTEGRMGDNSYVGYDGFDHTFEYPYSYETYHQVVNTEGECETDIVWDFTATVSPECDADFTMLGSAYTGDCEDCTFSFAIDVGPLGETDDCGLPGWMDFSDEAISERVLKHYDTFDFYGYEWRDVLLADYTVEWTGWFGETVSSEEQNILFVSEGGYSSYYGIFGYGDYPGISTFELSEGGFDFNGEGESSYSASYGLDKVLVVESSATFY